MFSCLRKISVLSILIIVSISIPVFSQDSLNMPIPLYMDNIWQKALENSKKIELSYFEESIGKKKSGKYNMKDFRKLNSADISNMLQTLPCIPMAF